MMELDSTSLRTLAAVVREGTFDAAARNLHITPSAVSQRIKALETAVGRVLVQRTSPCRPTGDGEVVLRLATQWEQLSSETAATLTGDTEPGHDVRRQHFPLGCNADSLATWFLPVIAEFQRMHPVAAEIHRDDEGYSARFLREGKALAAVTADPEPVRGCAVVPIGTMRYLPVASADFVAEWLPDGPRPDDMARAPMVAYDRNDSIQLGMAQRFTHQRIEPPITYVPASVDYHRAVELGIGWGMCPHVQIEAALADGRLATIGAEHVDVALYWQFWKLGSPVMNDLTALVTAAAAQNLRPPHTG